MARKAGVNALFASLFVAAVLFNAAQPTAAWIEELYGQWELLSRTVLNPACVPVNIKVNNASLAVLGFSNLKHAYFVDSYDKSAYAGSFTLVGKLVSVRVAAGIGKYPVGSSVQFNVSISGLNSNILTSYYRSPSGQLSILVYQRVVPRDSPGDLSASIETEWTAWTRNVTVKTSTRSLTVVNGTRSFVWLSNSLYSFYITNTPANTTRQYAVAGWADSADATVDSYDAFGIAVKAATDPVNDLFKTLVYNYKVMSGQLYILETDPARNVSLLTTYQRWK